IDGGMSDHIRTALY
ncbi:hypothetical protein, partial [Staphylococcus aureus]